MKPKIKGKGSPMSNDCDDTSIFSVSNIMIVNNSDTVIMNGLVGVSQTEMKATLVIFGHCLSIMNVYSTSAIDIHNGVVIAQMNGSSLI